MFPERKANMSCDISGSGCKICPGMWIAGLLLVVMMIQNLFFRPSVPSKDAAVRSANIVAEDDSMSKE
jgi:hypothetical protein